MKRWIKAGVIGVLSTTLIHAEGMKLYEVKSGKVSYEIRGSGNVMGSQTKSAGKKHLIFDNYGAQNLTEENKIDKTTAMERTQTNQTHTMTYMKDAVIYHVNFENKKIIRMENVGAMMMGGGDIGVKGKEMMKKMGGKNIGTDNVLGYECEVWELMGTKQCIYKGITLKTESNIMGIKNTEIATEAEFDISIDEDDFKLPDFPIKDGNSGTSIDKSSLDKMDVDDQKNMQEAQAQIAEAIGSLAKMAQDADMQKGQGSSAAQMEAMQKIALPMAKREILSEEPNIRKGRECLEDADSLEEAKQCQEKFNSEGENVEFFTEWDEQTKQKTLKEMDYYIDAIIPCVNKAESMDALEQCMM